MIATSLGQTFDNEGQFLAAQHDPQTYTSNEDQTSGQSSSTVPPGSPDRLYVSPKSGTNPDIEDRRNQSELDALVGYLKDQAGNLGPKLQGMLAHPMSSDTANATATLPVQESQLGDQLGLGDIPQVHRTTMEKLLGINGPRYQTWPERMVRDAISGAELPGDVAAGKADPYDPQRVQDLANLAVMGPLPATLATKAETGSLGSFAGIRSLRSLGEDSSSKYVDLGKAQVLESEGVHPDKVYAKTGFFRGADGQWRYEIDDSKSNFDSQWHTDPKNSNTQGAAMAPLKDILDHPDLFKAYPELERVLVYKDPDYPAAGAMWDGHDITMGSEAASNQGTLMHEVQHAIQQYEGHNKGGATDYNLKFDPAVRSLASRYQTIQRQISRTPEDQAELEHLDKIFKTYEQYKLAGKQRAGINYLRLAGEVEARNTDTRLLLNAKERRQLTPMATEDIARSNQAVFDRPKSATAYGYK